MGTYAVTGATGFVGRRLVEILIEDGHQVVAPLRKASPNYLHAAALRVDVENFDALTSAMKGCGGVFHLATMFRGSHTPFEIHDMVQSNVTLLALVCEAALAADVESLVYTESASQHVGGVDYSPFTLYAATKQAGADILRYYARQGLKTTCLTLFDTLGPGDTRGKLLSLLERTAKEGGTLQMSPGQQLVDYLYVDDVVSGLITAMKQTRSNDSGVPIFVRLSSSQPVPLRSFVEMVEEALGQRISVDWGAREYREGEMFEEWSWPPVLENWSPVVSLREGIGRALGSD